MIFNETYSIMSLRARRGALSAVFIRVGIALLEMIGVAALVGIMLVVLGGGSETANTIRTWLGISSYREFTVWVCSVLMVLFIIKSVLVILLSRISSRLMQNMFCEMSTQQFRKILDSGLLYIRSHNSSELINNATSVVLRFTEGIVGQMIAISGEVLMLMMIIAGLIIYDPVILVLAVAVFVPFTVVYAFVFRRTMTRNGQEENHAMVSQNRTLYETLRGYSDIKIYGAQDTVTNRFGVGLKKLAHLRLRSATIRISGGTIVEFSLVAGVVVMIVAGFILGRNMEAVRISLGVFAVAAYKIAPSVSKIVNSTNEIQRSRFAIERLTSIYNGQHEIQNPKSKIEFTQSITLNNISFTYPNGNEAVNNFSLTVAKGERVGIRGVSGIGKTTLLNIISGLFEPSSGELIVDGITITDENRCAWQDNLAYVSQDVFLLDGTIAENIAFGIDAEKIDIQRVKEVIDVASLTEFVDSLPNGIDTTTGEAGSRISGGQRQRIGIARALYKDAPMLLLDEATSSLDKTTEQAIIDALSNLSRDLTIVLVSHNERTLGLCTRIVSFN